MVVLRVKEKDRDTPQTIEFHTVGKHTTVLRVFGFELSIDNADLDSAYHHLRRDRDERPPRG